MRHCLPGRAKNRGRSMKRPLASARGRGAGGSLSAKAAGGSERPSSGVGSGQTAWISRIHQPIHMDSLCRVRDIWCVGRGTVAAEIFDQIRHGEITMVDLVDLAIPANAQATAEALGLKVHRSV